MEIASLEFWGLAQIILKFYKMSTFGKFQDKKSPKQGLFSTVSSFSMNLLQPFTWVFMGNKEADWFTNTLIYLYSVTEHSEENSSFVLGFVKSHHNFISH